MSPKITPRAFLNTRVRFQRLSDAKFFAGWVKDFSAGGILVRTSPSAAVAVGEKFMFQVHGGDASAIFKGTLTIAGADELCFSIVEQIKYLGVNEAVRLLVDGMSGVIETSGGPIEMLVVDVSSKGLGLVCHTQLERGTEYNMHLDCAQGPVSCVGEIRYCKADASGQYRIGVLLKEMNRVDQARWQRLILPEAA